LSLKKNKIVELGMIDLFFSPPPVANLGLIRPRPSGGSACTAAPLARKIALSNFRTQGAVADPSAVRRLTKMEAQ